MIQQRILESVYKRICSHLWRGLSVVWPDEMALGFVSPMLIGCSVPSAYEVRLQDSMEPAALPWEYIHEYRGWPRIIILLWIIYKWQLTSNTERTRRHLANDLSCVLCGGMVEDTSHIFRECKATRLAWKEVVKPLLFEDFMNEDIVNWIIRNLRQPNYYLLKEKNWDIFFGSMLWHKRKDSSGGRFGFNWCRKESIGGAPDHGWMKLNTDRSRNNLTGLTTCGGVFCNQLGEWHFGFSKCTVYCYVLDAELWGIYMGLSVAWDRNYRRIIVESDTTEVVNMINGSAVVQRFSTLLPHVQELTRRDWQLKFQSIPRAGNKVADGLARMAWLLPVAFVLHNEVSEEL
ncbi:hypothetical protein F3Y22_tig00014444pilonHSYRG00149 [Hibiscus syriacus]|uniref:RNase H type-1 domain-containing protein n=1 Tax=Hibiscus syriacus TaxID=106335 RepID=A0A6A3BYX2_HIBSY|nr:hypothetical protein F3Y22_tig00014444pilonHSYRG00149 [Hibiscus syriacus]